MPYNATNETFKCVHFNSKGLKQSIDYIANLLHSNDIVCLTETWLRPGELSGIHLWLKLYPMLLGVDFDVLCWETALTSEGHAVIYPCPLLVSVKPH